MSIKFIGRGSWLQLFTENRIRYRFTPAHCSPKLHTDLKGDYDNIGREWERERRKKIVRHTIHLASGLTHTTRSNFDDHRCRQNPQLAADVKEIPKWWFHVFSYSILHSRSLEKIFLFADRIVLHSASIANSLLTRNRWIGKRNSLVEKRRDDA